MSPIYKPGEVILYTNGDQKELGVVKRVGILPDTYFVWYHRGDTAACTHASNMSKILNLYAFDIRRKSPDEE